MPDPIMFTLDGKPVSAMPGQTIIQAAMDAGIYIPYLCYFPKMKPYGACRMCLVETEVKIVRKVKTKKDGKDVEEEQVTVQKATVASCTAPVQKDMVVLSGTDQVRDLRKGIVELLMTEHPHGCLTCHRIELCGPQDICQRHVGVTDRCTICPKNERCELKDTVRAVELDLRTPLNYHRRNLPIHTDDPFYDRDYNLCIVCARCVRVCEEVRFDTALTLTNRSGVSLVGTSHGSSLLESGCEFCGACVDACPVGALVERDYKWEKAARKVTTVCTNCPVGCQMVAEVNRFDKVIRFVGDLAGEANNGQACFKGKFAYDYPNAKSRLKYPYVREGGVLKRVTWDDALARAAAALSAYRPDQVAVLASPRGTNEDSYVAAKFARDVLKTGNVDSGLNTRPEIIDALRRRLGHSGATNPTWQLERAKCVLVVSGNPTEEQNVLAVPVKKAARADASIIVIDPRETELTRYAAEWLRVRPGTEAAALNLMMRVVLDEGLENKEFITARTDGVDALRASLSQMDIAASAAACGLDQEQVRRAARTFARSGASATLLGVDTAAPEARGALADAAVNLAMLTGNLGKDSAGVYPLYHGANTLGAVDMGCAPDPGGAGVQQLATEVRAGRIKAAVILADGLDPDADGMNGLREALGHLECLIVSAVFDTEVTAHASIVLPAAPYSEQQGTVTNVERRVQMVRRISPPKNEERPGWETLSRLARKMGADGFDYDGPAAVFAEIRTSVPTYAGLTYERLAAGEVQVPCTQDSAPGTPVLHTGSPAEQMLSFTPAAPSTPAHGGQGAVGLVLAHGRVLVQLDRDPGIVRKGNQNYIGREEIVSIHPEDARGLGISDGDAVQVLADPAGLPITGRARLDSPHRGVVSMTTLFGQLASAMQDDARPDPSPYVPGLPLRRVRLIRAAERSPVGAAR